MHVQYILVKCKDGVALVVNNRTMRYSRQNGRRG